MAYDYDKIKAHNYLMAKARVILKNRHLEEFLQIVKELENKRSGMRWICECGVCNATWSYPIETDESIVRASCSPCGHQGLFGVIKEGEIK